MTTFFRPMPAAASLAALALASAAHAQDARKHDDILVTAERQQQSIENTPGTRVTLTGDTIAATINAVNVEDTLKYLPSLVVRKRHIGDTQAPLATRTGGLGASARSLIYVDGALLSALIGNNNTSASPRWNMVSPQEIARIDVLYGPFSAAYPGNSIGAVVNITTKLPDRLEATVNAGTSVQTFDQYDTHVTLPARQIGVTLGDRFGPLALFASVDHVASDSQPLSYVLGAQPAGTRGGKDVLTRTDEPTRVLGATGLEHQRQDHVKLKAALDLGSAVRLTYVLGLFRNDTRAHAETYLTDVASGAPAYTGAFSSNVYHYAETHWSHALSASGTSGRLDWQVIGTLYDFAHDVQRSPTGLLPEASRGGAGTITRLDGTGWTTLDAKAAWRSDAAATHTISAGVHGDWVRLASERYVADDWLRGREGRLDLQSTGRTRTTALWAQDEWRLLPHFALTLGGRYEAWRAYKGANFSASPAIGPIDQPTRSADRFSPKASLAWTPDDAWTVRASFGEAWRFPTVGELYQVVTRPVPAVPDPDLEPERALSEELAVEHHDANGSVRLSLFNETVKDALISQLGPLPGSDAVGSYVQNVDRTRARGVELAVQRIDVLPRLDLSGSVTYADAITTKDSVFPAAEGKLLPQVPHWKATLVTTWRPADRVSLTAAARYSSRNFGALDNSDVVGNTFQGFYKYLVVDLRAEFRVTDHWSLGMGINNVTNDTYFLYHPFSQRSFAVDVSWKL